MQVSYRPLEAVVTPGAACAPDAPVLWDQAPGNFCFRHSEGDAVATEQAFALPRASHMPPIELTINQDAPCLSNPLGVKGAAEGGTVAAPPAVINALLNALRPLGVIDFDMPATPERVWRAIHMPS